MMRLFFQVGLGVVWGATNHADIGGVRSAHSVNPRAPRRHHARYPAFPPSPPSPAPVTLPAPTPQSRSAVKHLTSTYKFKNIKREGIEKEGIAIYGTYRDLNLTGHPSAS